jgi:cytochrome c oxidase cbb3-type subunit III
MNDASDQGQTRVRPPLLFVRRGILALASVVLAATSILSARARTEPPQTPAPDPAAVARGRTAFTTYCAACHGAEGRGGAEGATDLTRSLIAGSADGGTQLGAFLRVGRPERRMPAFSLSDADVADLSAFLRTVAAPPGRGGGRNAIPAVVVGDAAAGEKYFKGAGRCTECHSAAGDLKGIGSRLSVAAIQGRIVYPRDNGNYPPSFNSPPNPSEAPRAVTVTLPSGETISGTLMWLTDFYVTLKNAAGLQRTIARNGDTPLVVVTDPLQYHLDHMRTLTDKTMHDLTAYLVTLK